MRYFLQWLFYRRYQFILDWYLCELYNYLTTLWIKWASSIYDSYLCWDRFSINFEERRSLSKFLCAECGASGIWLLETILCTIRIFGTHRLVNILLQKQQNWPTILGLCMFSVLGILLQPNSFYVSREVSYFYVSEL